MKVHQLLATPLILTLTGSSAFAQECPASKATDASNAAACAQSEARAKAVADAPECPAASSCPATQEKAAVVALRPSQDGASEVERILSLDLAEIEAEIGRLRDDDAEVVVRRLAATDDDGHGYLGVELDLGARAAVVSRVLDGTPADDAGLEAGDVIVSVAGEEVDDMNGLLEMMQTTNPGEKIKVRVKRGAGTKDLDIVLGSRASLEVVRENLPVVITDESFAGVDLAEPVEVEVEEVSGDKIMNLGGDGELIVRFGGDGSDVVDLEAGGGEIVARILGSDDEVARIFHEAHEADGGHGSLGAFRLEEMDDIDVEVEQDGDVIRVMINGQPIEVRMNEGGGQAVFEFETDDGGEGKMIVMGHSASAGAGDLHEILSKVHGDHGGQHTVEVEVHATRDGHDHDGHDHDGHEEVNRFVVKGADGEQMVWVSSDDHDDEHEHEIVIEGVLDEGHLSKHLETLIERHGGDSKGARIDRLRLHAPDIEIVDLDGSGDVIEIDGGKMHVIDHDGAHVILRSKDGNVLNLGDRDGRVIRKRIEIGGGAGAPSGGIWISDDDDDDDHDDDGRRRMINKTFTIGAGGDGPSDLWVESGDHGHGKAHDEDQRVIKKRIQIGAGGKGIHEDIASGKGGGAREYVFLVDDGDAHFGGLHGEHAEHGDAAGLKAEVDRLKESVARLERQVKRLSAALESRPERPAPRRSDVDVDGLRKDIRSLIETMERSSRRDRR